MQTLNAKATVVKTNVSVSRRAVVAKAAVAEAGLKTTESERVRCPCPTAVSGAAL